MEPFIFLSSILGFLLLLATYNLLRFRKKYGDLCIHQISLDKKISELDDENRSLKDSLMVNCSFSKDLQEADSTSTDLKLSQSRYHSTITRTAVPERYHYIKSLSNRCSDSTELAQLCSVSPREAEQLRALSRLNRNMDTG